MSLPGILEWGPALPTTKINDVDGPGRKQTSSGVQVRLSFKYHSAQYVRRKVSNADDYMEEESILESIGTVQETKEPLRRPARTLANLKLALLNVYKTKSTLFIDQRGPRHLPKSSSERVRRCHRNPRPIRKPNTVAAAPGNARNYLSNVGRMERDKDNTLEAYGTSKLIHAPFFSIHIALDGKAKELGSSQSAATLGHVCVVKNNSSQAVITIIPENNKIGAVVTMDTTSRAPDSSFATITFDPCVFSVLSHMLESMRKFLDAIVLSDMVCPKLTPDTRKENNSLLLSRTLREASRRSERVKPADKQHKAVVMDGSRERKNSRAEKFESKGSTDKPAKKMMKKRRKIDKSKKPEPILQINTTLDAVDYFAAYANAYNERYSKASRLRPKRRKVVEEDVCFMCKDGGDLVGCDCTPAFRTKIKPRDKQLVCQKLYHQECLGFSIPKHEMHWTCPRHFCTQCGNYGKYLCLYCPISFCKSCTSKVNKLEHLYIDAWDQGRKYTGARSYVICSNCTRLEKTALQRGIIKTKVRRRISNN